MSTQQQIANKKVVLFNKNWDYYVFFQQRGKISKSGPWSQGVANSLRNELLINNICAWIKRLDDNKE